MQHVIGIPSYRRSDKQSTLELLKGAYSKDEIILSTQTEDDFVSYQKYSNDATLIYGEGSCVSDNRNNILRYCEENRINNVLMLDDDITSIKLWGGSMLRDSVKIRMMFNKLFETATKAGSPIFGTIQNDNACFFNMKPSLRALFTGTLFGVLDNTLRFDRNMRIKEDYELCLRVISSGKNCIRFNSFCPTAKHKSKGGCEDEWNKDTSVYADMLVAAYPEICMKDKKRKNEILLKRL